MKTRNNQDVVKHQLRLRLIRDIWYLNTINLLGLGTGTCLYIALLYIWYCIIWFRIALYTALFIVKCIATYTVMINMKIGIIKSSYNLFYFYSLGGGFFCIPEINTFKLNRCLNTWLIMIGWIDTPVRNLRQTTLVCSLYVRSAI